MTMKRESHAKITEMNDCGWYHTVVQHTINITIAVLAEKTKSTIQHEHMGRVRSIDHMAQKKKKIHCPYTVKSGDLQLLAYKSYSLSWRKRPENMFPFQREIQVFTAAIFWSPRRMLLHPILDLCLLNCFLWIYRFKMLTLKLIVSHIQSKDWFVTIDLKDAYFHIEILPSLPILCSSF